MNVRSLSIDRSGDKEGRKKERYGFFVCRVRIGIEFRTKIKMLLFNLVETAVHGEKPRVFK